MRGRGLILLLDIAFTATMLGAIGCSGGSSPQGTISKNRFAKEADLICTRTANEQPEKATFYLEEHPNADEADLVEPVVIPSLEAMVTKLAHLNLPSQYEARAEHFISE